MSFSEPTFFWHDYETFGRYPRRDRPAQFAGIRTNYDLEEIGNPLMIYCRPTPDYLPDPESCLLTGITPQICWERGLPEYEFAAQIERALSTPGTIGVGYNTLRFDDEVTRFLFWRNLIDPYAREWQNQCGRWDLLDVVRAMWALRPQGIQWPTHEDGRPSFKLEDLTRANGLTHDAAHDALSDVRATIGLARLIRQAQPKLWEFCFKLRTRAGVLNEIGVGRPFLHISGMYGVERGCMAIVWPLAPHPTNKNEIIVWDLAHDPQELLGLSSHDIRTRLFTKSEDLPEGVDRLPIKTIHLNKSPIVISQLKTLSPERAAQFGINVQQALHHAERWRDEGAKLAGLWPDVFERQKTSDTVDVDQDLYGGFIGPEDRRQLQRLRAMPPEELVERHVGFEDDRLEELVFRYRARNFPQLLNPQDQERWQAHCAATLHDGQGSTTTLASFMDHVDRLFETTDEQGQAILEALMDYAESIAPEIS